MFVWLTYLGMIYSANRNEKRNVPRGAKRSCFWICKNILFNYCTPIDCDKIKNTEDNWCVFLTEIRKPRRVGFLNIELKESSTELFLRKEWIIVMLLEIFLKFNMYIDFFTLLEAPKRKKTPLNYIEID